MDWTSFIVISLSLLDIIPIVSFYYYIKSRISSIGFSEPINWKLDVEDKKFRLFFVRFSKTLRIRIKNVLNTSVFKVRLFIVTERKQTFFIAKFFRFYWNFRLILFYCPGPDSDFSINFFLAKHNHHLLGLPSSPKTLSQTRIPVSWRICCRYWRIKSETKKKNGEMQEINDHFSVTCIGRRAWSCVDRI